MLMKMIKMIILFYYLYTILYHYIILYVPVVTVLARDNQKMSKIFSKRFEIDQFTGMNIK